MNDEFSEHRIVVNADSVRVVYAAVDTQLRTGRRVHEPPDSSGGWKEVTGRIFGVDACLDCMSPLRYVRLAKRQWLAGGNFQLPFDQVKPRHHFGDRVFDLEACVHLHKIESAVLINNKLNRAGVPIRDGSSSGDRCITHAVACRIVQERRRRFLDDFLIAALYRAFTFTQLNEIAGIIAKDLKFYVARRDQVLFDNHPVIIERAGGHAPRTVEGRFEFLLRMDDAHALAATTGAGLDQHRKADFAGCCFERRDILVVPVVTGDRGHAGIFHEPFC